MPEQRVPAEAALRGVTIEAAYSLKLENEIGSIQPGKRANLTVLEENPLTVDPATIKDIGVWGTVMEGRKLPAGYLMERKDASLAPRTEDIRHFASAAMQHAYKVSHNHLPISGSSYRFR